jgi:MFS family permease
LSQIKNLPFFYGYIMVATAFAILMFTEGILASFGIFFTPIIEDFGWDRASLSGVVTLNSILYGTLSLAAGRLSDKIGPRLSLVITGLSVGLGVLLMSQVNAAWQLYLCYGVMGGMGTGFGVVPLTSVIARWFVQKRSLMNGIALSSMGVGTITLPLIVNSFIETQGWRDAAFIVGGVTLVVIVVAAQLVKRDPAQMGMLPYGADKEVAVLNSVEEGISFGDAIRTRQFKMLIVAYVCPGFVMMAAMVHIVPHAIDLGISATSAAGIMSIIGVGGLISRLVFGRLADKNGNTLLLIISVALISCSAFLLLIATQLWQFYIIAVLFGLGQGGVSVTMSPIVAEFFGLRWHGTIQGFLVLIMTLSISVSPIMAGRIFDITGSYYLAWLIGGIISTTGLALTFMLKHSSRGGIVDQRRSP